MILLKTKDGTVNIKFISFWHAVVREDDIERNRTAFTSLSQINLLAKSSAIFEKLDFISGSLKSLSRIGFGREINLKIGKNPSHDSPTDWMIRI